MLAPLLINFVFKKQVSVSAVFALDHEDKIQEVPVLTDVPRAICVDAAVRAAEPC
jgi:hypothetical protein